MKIKKGDKIIVIAGKDRGREGAVERVYPKSGRAVVAGINKYKKHIKKSEQSPNGGVVEVSRAIDLSKIMFKCPKCGKATRVGYEVVKGKKNRICRKCKSKV